MLKPFSDYLGIHICLPIFKAVSGEKLKGNSVEVLICWDLPQSDPTEPIQ